MPVIAIQELVSKLRCCTEADFLHIDRIRELLCTSPVDPKSIEQYLIWDAQHYTRNLIEKTPLFELLAICWETGQGSSIHNHKEQNCWMAVPIGRLLVQNYRVVVQDLAQGTCDLVPSDVIENPPEGSAIAEAKEFGVDLYMLLENLKLTPAERLRRAGEETDFIRRIRENLEKADSSGLEQLIQSLVDMHVKFIVVGSY